MSCYHPLLRVEDLTRPETALDGHKYYKARIIGLSKETEIPEDIIENPKYKYQIIPCTKCIGCRLDYSREWANRGYLESIMWKHNYFVTLTYSDENLRLVREQWTKDEFYATVNKKDMQKFLHDLRQEMSRKKLQTCDIRYMGCAEYGDQGLRPHMHLILFNCNLPLWSFYAPKIINENIYYQNNIIEKCWKKGFSNISEASWNTIAYTARYITKKIKGKDAKIIYDSLGIEPEYLATSRRGGIGRPYYEKYWKEIYEKDQITIHNKKGTIQTQPPKYFDDLYKKDHPKEFREIQRKRQKRALNINRIRDQQTSLTRLEQLEIEEATQGNKNQQLIRSFEKG